MNVDPLVREKIQRLYLALCGEIGPVGGTGPVNVTALAKRFGVSRPTIHRWLRHLADAGKIHFAPGAVLKPAMITLLGGVRGGCTGGVRALSDTAVSATNEAGQPGDSADYFAGASLSLSSLSAPGGVRGQNETGPDAGSQVPGSQVPAARFDPASIPKERPENWREIARAAVREWKGWGVWEWRHMRAAMRGYADDWDYFLDDVRYYEGKLQARLLGQ